MGRLSKNRPFSDAKKSAMTQVKRNAVSSVTSKVHGKPEPQFGFREDPFGQMTTTKNPKIKKVARTVGGTYPWKSKKRSNSSSTHKQA